ncbi:OLC1v1014106C1 [Oldenlandia corymbosa var. corymbosa]|uniref:OLC1v1014106C1 n=1 Tax=Oldenlandia corymbosa var. corymbosa TaxID=529605 RepID=A0AAV1E208_OLDCO|nr:OLC1v1014106C1 [Oldenlandia corymbosa var. corymbosa]
MLAPSSSSSSSALKWVVQTPFHGFPHCPNCPSQQSPISSIKFPDKTRRTTPRFSILQTKASIDEKLPVLDPDVQEQPTSRQEVEESVRVLKNAAKTRKVPAKDILSAFAVIEKAKIDPSGFLETLGGTESPGRTWMLIFTAQVICFYHFCYLLGIIIQLIFILILIRNCDICRKSWKAVNTSQSLLFSGLMQLGGGLRMEYFWDLLDS